MVARLKLKEIDGRAPPGVNRLRFLEAAVNSAPKSRPKGLMVFLGLSGPELMASLLARRHPQTAGNS